MKELIHCFLFGVKHRQKYPEVVRRFCLDIYYLSVITYESIRSTFNNNLPHTATIRSWYANSDMNAEPGISESCLKVLLQKKAIENKSKGNEFLVSICFDEMYIKKHFQWCNTSKHLSGFPTYGPGALDSDVLFLDSEEFTDLDISEAAN